MCREKIFKLFHDSKNICDEINKKMGRDDSFIIRNNVEFGFLFIMLLAFIVSVSTIEVAQKQNTEKDNQKQKSYARLPIEFTVISLLGGLGMSVILSKKQRLMYLSKYQTPRNLFFAGFVAVASLVLIIEVSEQNKK